MPSFEAEVVSLVKEGVAIWLAIRASLFMQSMYV